MALRESSTSADAPHDMTPVLSPATAGKLPFGLFLRFYVDSLLPWKEFLLSLRYTLYVMVKFLDLGILDEVLRFNYR